MKRALIVLTLLAFASVAWAGHDHSKEFANCHVCSKMASQMHVLGPAMANEIVTMSNGVAIVHNITDPEKVEMFQKISAQMSEAGAACMTMTDAEASKQLCSLCQDIRTIMAAGGQMSKGMTAMGDLMVISSDDPTVQKQIAALEGKMKHMMAPH